jgi:hypothetical protein
MLFMEREIDADTELIIGTSAEQPDNSTMENSGVSPRT